MLHIVKNSTSCLGANLFFFFFHFTLLDKKEDKISENNSIFNFCGTAFSGKMAKY